MAFTRYGTNAGYKQGPFTIFRPVLPKWCDKIK
jgi:hypothetical protein